MPRPCGGRSRALVPVLVLACGAAAAGCSADYYARRILKHETLPGKASQAALGTGEHLVRTGQITAHRRIAAPDGVQIDTWVIRAAPRPGARVRPGGTVLLLHGLMDGKERHYGLGKWLSRMGYDAVLVDFRAHGRSGGRYVTWGAKEKYDVKAVVDALLAEKLIQDRVYVLGHSMGAATAVMYAAIDGRCRGVLAIAPYKDARSVTRRFAPLMSDEKFEQAWRRAAELGGFDPDEASTVAAAATLRCPLLVVHGGVDSIVPYDHGKAVFDACPGPKKLVTLPLAGHVSVLLGREAWFARQIDELDRLARDARAPSATSREAGSP